MHLIEDLMAKLQSASVTGNLEELMPPKIGNLITEYSKMLGIAELGVLLTFLISFFCKHMH